MNDDAWYVEPGMYEAIVTDRGYGAVKLLLYQVHKRVIMRNMFDAYGIGDKLQVNVKHKRLDSDDAFLIVARPV